MSYTTPPIIFQQMRFKRKKKMVNCPFTLWKRKIASVKQVSPCSPFSLIVCSSYFLRHSWSNSTKIREVFPKNLRRGKNGLEITQDHFINQCRNEAKTDNFFLIFSDLVLPDSKETTTALPPPRRTLSCADQFRSPSNALPLFKRKTIIWSLSSHVSPTWRGSCWYWAGLLLQ